MNDFVLIRYKLSWCHIQSRASFCVNPCGALSGGSGGQAGSWPFCFCSTDVGPREENLKASDLVACSWSENRRLKFHNRESLQSSPFGVVIRRRSDGAVVRALMFGRQWEEGGVLHRDYMQGFGVRQPNGPSPATS